jgi:hypothetical protein
MTPANPKRKRGKPAREPSVLGYGDLGTSLLFIFPLFLAYEIGVAFTPAGNGVDFVTEWVFAAVGHDRGHYIIFNLVLVGLFVALILYLRTQNMLQVRRFLPMLFLSGIYALTLGSFILFVMDKMLGFDGLMQVGEMDGSTKLIISLGAGVHEELIFRLGLLAGGAYVIRALGIRHNWAVFIALVVSALVFSAAHHIGPAGEPWSTVVFTYRSLAGAIFGVLFYFQSLSHAVYTHFLYDTYVLVFQS